MADPVVSFVLESLGDLIIQEVVFLKGVSGQIEGIKNKLRWMHSFLKDADTKQEENDRVRTWVADIRDAAYDTEDVIDTFILKVASRRRGGLQGVLKRFTCIFTEWKDLYMAGKKIKAIQIRLQNISENLKTVGIKNIGEVEGTSSANELQRLLMRRSYPHVEDQDIIGLEEDTEKLVAELIKEEELRRVVSIVGVGGLGKTSLAKKVYNRNDVKSHFDCCAWAFISQQCRPREILQEISRKFNISINQEMGEEELVENLDIFLKEKRYLLVLDDIWRAEAWDILRPAFLNGKIGSKILLTTRNEEVIWHVDPRSFIHRPQFLTEEKSWDLFCKKAFLENASTSHSLGLEKLGKEMVRRCGGLPLAIAVLGGLLATKKSLKEWDIVRKNISSHLNKGQLGVLEILALSYNDLPYRLKPCFLYFGIFPEDSEIPIRKLIKLWVAEGFLRGEGEETMEDMGELYLAELINRNMVQMDKTMKFLREVKICRVHDLMRDLCILNTKETNFLDIFHHGDRAVDSSDRLRRHAIHFGHERYVSLKHTTPHLHSLLFFHPKIDYEISMKFISRDFKLLRVLDLEGVQVVKKRLPREIGKLLHLRYLGLRDTNIKELPSSIGNLRSLQTLDLRGCDRGLIIPNVIQKMEQLRHLYVDTNYPSDHLRLGTLRNLQTLKYIKCRSWLEDGLANLTNLQKFGVSHMSRSEAEVVLNYIAVRPDCLLRSLYLWLFEDNETFPDLEPLSHFHRLLKLNLRGRINTEKLLQWPSNLTKLILSRSRLQQDSMATLQNLPNLVSLKLYSNAYVGKEVVCSAKGFPQLQFLELYYLNELEEWRVEEGAMPCLRRLWIFKCEKLRTILEGLRFVTTLQELIITNMPDEFCNRVRRGGEDWYKVQHIPSIEVDFQMVK